MNSPLDLPSLTPLARDRGATPAAEPSNGGAQLPAADVAGVGERGTPQAPRPDVSSTDPGRLTPWPKPGVLTPDECAELGYRLHEGAEIPTGVYVLNFPVPVLPRPTAQPTK